MKKDIDDYIKKQNPPQREICRKIRKLILQSFSGIEEEAKWGALVFGGGKFYVGALKDHVNVGFSIEGLNEKEIALFEGKGMTMRHIKIRTPEDIEKKQLSKLLRIVYKKAKCGSTC